MLGYNYALSHAAQPGGARWVQFVLVLGLVAVSFAIHLLYLPAGIACFVALMLQKTELLMPPRAAVSPGEKKRY